MEGGSSAHLPEELPEDIKANLLLLSWVKLRLYEVEEGVYGVWLTVNPPEGAPPGDYVLRASGLCRYNPDNTDIKDIVITVKAAYERALAESNYIQLHTPDALFENETLSFTAHGHRQNASGINEKGQRYVPESWSINPSGNFADGEPYSAAPVLTTQGNYTLSVVFRLQQFTNGTWQDTEQTDVKTLPITVAKKEEVSPSPSPSASPSGNQSPSPSDASPSKGASPATGDASSCTALLIILCLSIVACFVLKQYKKI